MIFYIQTRALNVENLCFRRISSTLPAPGWFPFALLYDSTAVWREGFIVSQGVNVSSECFQRMFWVMSSLCGFDPLHRVTRL